MNSSPPPPPPHASATGRIISGVYTHTNINLDTNPHRSSNSRDCIDSVALWIIAAWYIRIRSGKL